MREKYNVIGMTCSACQASVEKAVSRVPGVQEVAVSLLTNSMQVEHGEEATREAIIGAVRHAGYDAQVAGSPGKQEKAPMDVAGQEVRGMRAKFWWSLGF